MKLTVECVSSFFHRYILLSFHIKLSFHINSFGESYCLLLQMGPHSKMPPFSSKTFLHLLEVISKNSFSLYFDSTIHHISRCRGEYSEGEWNQKGEISQKMVVKACNAKTFQSFPKLHISFTPDTVLAARALE